MCTARPLGSAVVLALMVAVPGSGLAGQEVENTSYTAPDGSRVLQHSVVVDAPAADVWDAFTTTEGVKTWAVPFANVDFRLGGIWESSYRLDARIGDPANIKNKFLAYLPARMVVIQAVQAPPNFPHRELLEEIFTVFELKEVDAKRTRVTVSMVGYEQGDGYDVVYRHFAAGNDWSLKKLHQRFSQGPVDWQALLSPKSR